MTTDWTDVWLEKRKNGELMPQDGKLLKVTDNLQRKMNGSFPKLDDTKPEPNKR